MSSVNLGVSFNFSRTTSQLGSQGLLSDVRRTQTELLKVQQAISSGKSVRRPGDAPAKASAIMFLQQQTETRQQHERNLQHAGSVLNSTDAALADVSEILLEARAIGSSQIGIGSNADTRANQATVIDGQLQALMDIVNRKVAGVGLFVGGQGGDAFEDFLGGVRYLGQTGNLSNETGFSSPLSFNTNGAEAFQALSGRVRSEIDLNPQAAAATPLRDIAGARGQGVQPGTVALSVDGQEVVVDLASADTLGDVVTRVNQAIGEIDAAAGSLSVGGDGFTLNANAGHAIRIQEAGPGTTAADLGIVIEADGAAVAGQDVNPRLTPTTRLADLGGTIDWAGGLTLTHGEVSKVADFSNAQTVQDLVNVIDRLDLGVRLGINQDGTGLNLVSEVSGIHLSVSEANGGSTATDLGLRTLTRDTLLEDFNFGRGVEHVSGEDDFQVTLSDGTSFSVDISGAISAGDVMDRIREAANLAGLTVGEVGEAGTQFNVGLAVAGNGFQLEDNTGGSDDLVVENLGLSLAATDLGLNTRVSAGNSLVGEDVTQVRVESLFTHLIDLRNSLARDDSRGITFASQALEEQFDRLARVRADVGVRAQRAEQQLDRSTEMGLAEGSLLSNLQDADLTQVITRFQQLQMQLQASFQVGAQHLQMSLLDFLR